MTSQPAKPPVNFIDNPHAPDVFADAVAGVFAFNGVLRLTFEALRANHIQSPGPVNRVVIGRVVIPIEAAKNLRDLLTDFLGQAEQAAPGQAQGTPTIQ